MLTEGWTDEQTDITKLIVAVRNFAGGPKNPRHAMVLYQY